MMYFGGMTPAFTTANCKKTPFERVYAKESKAHHRLSVYVSVAAYTASAACIRLLWAVSRTCGGIPRDASY